MMVMTCDRCGKFIPEGEDEGGRCRLAKMDKPAGGQEVVADLCNECQAVTYKTLLTIVTGWKVRANEAA